MLKKVMIAGLMAATVMGGVAPAYAQRADDGGWRGRGQQSARSDGGGDQRSRGWQRSGEARQQPQAGWAPRQAERPAAQPDRPRVEQRWNRERQSSRDAARAAWRNDARRTEQSRDERPQSQINGREVAADWRNQRGDDRREGRWNNSDRTWSGNRTWSNNRAVERRFDDRTRWNGQRRWDNGWRQDRRYDWYSYRSRYADRYRIGRYYSPRGWDYGYRSYSIGIFLNSLLFSNNYWINDPWYYRLPPAYGTLRWIRYYDDALLVDIRDGYVVDVIHDFFW